jgi:non-canonical poly(A) RNA polymerase PAPD5/7
MPGTQSKNLVPEEHLGQLFLEFLELYGKKFDLASTMISMSPPKYLRKVNLSSFAAVLPPLNANNLQERWGPDGRQMKPDKLTIIDPSRPDNDISGGSSRAKFIFGLFARAHDNLLDRMADLLINRPSFGNVLDAVFKGNYSIYLEQRAHLRAIHDAAVSYRPPPTQDSQSQGISIKGRSRGGGGNSNTSNGSSNAGRGRSDAGRGKQSRGRGRFAGRPEKRQRT